MSSTDARADAQDSAKANIAEKQATFLGIVDDMSMIRRLLEVASLAVGSLREHEENALGALLNAAREKLDTVMADLSEAAGLRQGARHAEPKGA